MRNIIYWRSHQTRGQPGLGSIQNIRGRGSEYESLRIATSHDDARDIAWKKSSGSDTLYVKSREDISNLSVRLIGIRDKSWSFTVEKGEDKDTFYASLDRACRESMIHYRYSYDVSVSLDIGSSVGQIIRRKIQKNIILYIVSNFDIISYVYLSQLSKMNDIIVIHLLHPYEADPDMDSTLLFESRRIDSIRYKEALLKSRTDIRKYLEKNNIAYISAVSTDNPVTLLNHFFKYRYAR